MENLINLSKELRKELVQLVKTSNEKVFIHKNDDNRNSYNETYRNMLTARDDLRCSIYTISNTVTKEYNKVSSIHHSADLIYCPLIKMLDDSHLVDIPGFLLSFDSRVNQLFRDHNTI